MGEEKRNLICGEVITLFQETSSETAETSSPTRLEYQDAEHLQHNSLDTRQGHAHHGEDRP